MYMRKPGIENEQNFHKNWSLHFPGWSWTTGDLFLEQSRADESSHAVSSCSTAVLLYSGVACTKLLFLHTPNYGLLLASELAQMAFRWHFMTPNLGLWSANQFPDTILKPIPLAPQQPLCSSCLPDGTWCCFQGETAFEWESLGWRPNYLMLTCSSCNVTQGQHGSRSCWDGVSQCSSVIPAQMFRQKEATQPHKLENPSLPVITIPGATINSHIQYFYKGRLPLILPSHSRVSSCHWTLPKTEGF